jgi:hypothetical protein
MNRGALGFEDVAVLAKKKRQRKGNVEDGIEIVETLTTLGVKTRAVEEEVMDSFMRRGTSRAKRGVDLLAREEERAEATSVEAKARKLAGFAFGGGKAQIGFGQVAVDGGQRCFQTRVGGVEIELLLFCCCCFELLSREGVEVGGVDAPKAANDAEFTCEGAAKEAFRRDGGELEQTMARVKRGQRAGSCAEAEDGKLPMQTERKQVEFGEDGEGACVRGEMER